MAPIPAFCDNYHLPPGEHICNFAEIEERFLFTEERQRVWKLCQVLMDRFETLGLRPQLILIDGSFVTGRRMPEDVDGCILLPPEVIEAAIQSGKLNDHDINAIRLILHPDNKDALRDLFGAHLFVVHDEAGVEFWSTFFRRGKDGRLRDPDPDRDPEGVTRPNEKGILRVIL